MVGGLWARRTAVVDTSLESREPRPVGGHSRHARWPCSRVQSRAVWLGTDLEIKPGVALAPQLRGRDQRRAPRVDVLRRVRGTLIPVESPIVIHDLSHTGFGAISHIDFRRGDILDFRLETPTDQVTVTARVVHSRPFGTSADQFVTGFEFVAKELLGQPPRSRIDQLIEAVTVHEGLLAISR